MLARVWLIGLVHRHPVRLAAIATGIAITVALLGTLAGFFAATETSMTRQAISSVTVDWQVQLAQGTDPRAAAAELARAPGYRQLAEVTYFATPGLQATTNGTVQTTGAGQVLGLAPNYRTAFPAEIRTLLGAGNVLLAQQTAANLHAMPGTAVTIQRPGLPPVVVRVDAIVDLPFADSLFQTVGAQAGAGPTAPPDNVLLLPLAQWHQLFDPVTQTAPSAMHTQLHVTLPHTLAADPQSAYTDVTGRARNYEIRMAGSALVGDNLAAQLDAARSDALYAQVLFLFLGLPGAILAGLLTAVLIASGAAQRRHDQALLRVRGAATGQVVRLAAVEAAAVGLAGDVLGLGLALITVRLAFGHWTFGQSATATLTWAATAAAAGLGLALAAILLPAWRDATSTDVAAARYVSRERRPVWERIGLDGIMLMLSGFIYWRIARGGYQVVLAPEGTPHVAVSYAAFFAPLLLWAGVALLVMRLSRLLLGRRGRIVAPVIAPLGGRLSQLVAASLSRQRAVVTTGLVMVALAVAFATSTAIFNSTYQAQARVDAQLTNGADVTVTGPAATDLGGHIAQLRSLAGVQAVEPMQHRFAYVGTDLQDLYGIRPERLGQATSLADAFFAGGNAQAVLGQLAHTPDGLLVSAETVRDFQLQPGDLIRLRLQNAHDHRYHVVPFHYVGIAREFPTAPRDSFLVANASYIAAQTGTAAVETLLLRTSGSPADVAHEVRQVLGPGNGATVQDIETQRQITNSNLTAISLKGLTRIELVFAVLLAGIGAGLVLALGLEARRRTLAIAAALGAKPRQLGAFVWSEAGLIVAGGLIAGAGLGWGIALMLIKLLTGVFDPPPEHATIPWPYLILVAMVTMAAAALAAGTLARFSPRSMLETLRSG